MAPTTPGKQAVIRYVEETAAGTTPTNPALLLFSPEVQSIKYHLDKQGKESHDVGELDAHEYYTVQNAYGVSVVFHVYDEDRLTALLARNVADETPKSYTLEIIPDQDATTPHYIRGVGWRAGTVKVSGKVDEAWVCEITFTAGSIAAPTTTDPGIGTGSREAPTAFSDPLRVFSNGAITLDGSPIATLVGSFEFTQENAIEPQYTQGQADPVPAAVAFGKRTYSGTADISLDDGVKEHWDRVNAYASHEIRLPFGTTTGDGIVVLEGVKFPRIEVEHGIDTDVVRGNEPFTARTHSTAAVA